jgi:hypothetical protein
MAGYALPHVPLIDSSNILERLEQHRATASEAINCHIAECVYLDKSVTWSDLQNSANYEQDAAKIALKIKFIQAFRELNIACLEISIAPPVKLQGAIQHMVDLLDKHDAIGLLNLIAE